MGTFGNIGIFSFYPTKNLGAIGDGGMLITDDEILATRLISLRQYGWSSKYNISLTGGMNSRLDELQAAFLRVKLNYLEEWTNQRKEIASWYNTNLINKNWILPEVHKNADHVYHLYVIRTNERNKLQVELNAKGIQTMIHYPVPPHLQKAYKQLGFKKGDFPIAEEIAKTCLSLPVWPGMQLNFNI